MDNITREQVLAFVDSLKADAVISDEEHSSMIDKVNEGELTGQQLARCISPVLAKQILGILCIYSGTTATS